MNGIPVGMYIYGDSKLHKTSPELKLILLLAVILMIFLANSWLSVGIILLVLYFGIFFSGLKINQALGLVGRLRWFFLFIFLMNTVFFRAQSQVPDTVIFSYKIFRISLVGVVQGLRIIFRTAAVLVAGTLYTSTTPPIRIIESLQWMMRPLGFLGIPVRQIAVIFSAAIQFIPTLYEESDRIKKAQIARGARLEGRGLVTRAVGVLPMVLPIFMVSFRRADELALALESRGYSSQSQKAYRCCRKVYFKKMDWAILIVCFLLLGLIILVNYLC